MFVMSCCLYCSGPELSADDSEEAEKVENIEIYFIAIRQLFNVHAISHPQCLNHRYSWGCSPKISARRQKMGTC